jgi:hypothetical protein
MVPPESRPNGGDAREAAAAAALRRRTGAPVELSGQASRIQTSSFNPNINAAEGDRHLFTPGRFSVPEPSQSTPAFATTRPESGQPVFGQPGAFGALRASDRPFWGRPPPSTAPPTPGSSRLEGGGGGFARFAGPPASLGAAGSEIRGSITTESEQQSQAADGSSIKPDSKARSTVSRFEKSSSSSALHTNEARPTVPLFGQPTGPSALHPNEVRQTVSLFGQPTGSSAPNGAQPTVSLSDQPTSSSAFRPNEMPPFTRSQSVSLPTTATTTTTAREDGRLFTFSASSGPRNDQRAGASSLRAGRPGDLPRLIPLFPPSARPDGVHHPPFSVRPPSSPFGFHAPPTPSSSQATPWATTAGLESLRSSLPSLSDEQLQDLSKLSRKGIEERLRLLGDMQGFLERAVEQMALALSVLPPDDGPFADSGRPTAGNSGARSAARSTPASNEAHTVPSMASASGHSAHESDTEGGVRVQGNGKVAEEGSTEGDARGAEEKGTGEDNEAEEVSGNNVKGKEPAEGIHHHVEDPVENERERED